MYREFRCINLNTEHSPALIFLPTHSTNRMWLLISYWCQREDISRPRNWAVDMENIWPSCHNVPSGWITGNFLKRSAGDCSYNDVQTAKFYRYIRNIFQQITLSLSLSLLKPNIYEISVFENSSKPIKNVQGVSSSAWTDRRTNRNDGVNVASRKVVLLGVWLVIGFDVFRYFFRVPPRPPMPKLHRFFIDLTQPNPTQPKLEIGTNLT